MNEKKSSTNSNVSRRQFIHTGSKLVAAGAAMNLISSDQIALARAAHVGGSDTIKLGLIGAGGRGTGAVVQAIDNKSMNVELTAIGDVFENRLRGSLSAIPVELGEENAGKVKVPESHQFHGFDAFQRVLDTDCDMVILATPPGFRPLHFEAAVNAGKHVFMEKPVAVDAPGVRRVLTAGQIAAQKGLVVQVGLQRRHEEAYRQMISELQNGAIGDLICSRVYWNNPGLWVNPRRPGQSELEYQMRNWYYFNWLCGDHIVEQHIHNIDVIHWLLNDFPVRAQGQGGRQVRTGIDHGQIYDHHFVEYTFANGHKMFSQCRHMPDTWDQVSEYVHGSNGSADISGGRIFDKNGNEIFRARGTRNGHHQEHINMFADIAAGKIPNEADYGAKSTMASIQGRLATYTGLPIDWDKAINSQISLCNVDALESMDSEAPVQPNEEGRYPIPMPGSSKKDVIDW
jgi:myo-inositol 2-dehydrogenase / D-chiro-inositol 1-dehydrogenase